MIQVSIDMSKNDETAEHRIFGNVIDIQNDMLLCEYTGANFDFDNTKKIAVLEEKLKKETSSLKELLREWLAAYPVIAVTSYIGNFAKIQKLLDKTNEALK